MSNRAGSQVPHVHGDPSEGLERTETSVDDERALLTSLGTILHGRLGTRSAIAAIRRAPSRFATSYATEILTVRSADGEELKVFLKDFGVCKMHKDLPGHRRDRELRVYRELLAGSGLGTPEHYGSVWNEAQGRFWLLLEFVDGMALRYCKFEYWVGAARWLGRMQGYFGPELSRFNACDFLVMHDAAFFLSKAERAMDEVGQISATLSHRLGTVVSRYGPLVDVMARQRPVLVHGDYRPKNILVNAGSEPARVCPIDWESAAVGSPLYDITFLCDGFEPPKLDRLWDAYCEEAVQHHVPLPNSEEAMYVADCFRLHRLMKRLSKCLEMRFSLQTVTRAIDRLEWLCSRLV